MWRCHRLRASLVALVAVPTYLSSPAERMAPRCSGVTSDAAGEVPIADCAGLGALPAPIVEDLSLSFDGIEAIVCEELVTLTVNSGTELFWRLGVSGDSEDATGSALRLHNVRVVVEEAAKLTVGMAVEEAEAGSIRGDQGGIPLATLTLEGAAQQGSNGGALEVKHGGQAVFLVPVHFAENSVANGFSGGALHVDGEVTFKHAAHFAGNRAAAAAFGEDVDAPVVTISSLSSSSVSSSSVSSPSVPSSSAPPSSPSSLASSGGHGDEHRRPCGGGVSIGRSGRINFWEFVSFEDNYSAGRGGAVCNRGWAKFIRRSFFSGNEAAGGASVWLQDRDGGLVDGNGGAVCTEEGSATTFTRRSSMLRNRAGGSGGAIFNAGVMTFETSAEFRGNGAAVVAATAGASEGLDFELEAGGGHLFNRGFLHIKGDASFRQGFSGADGGAVYTISGEDTVLGGISSFEANTAGGICEDVFSSVAGSEVKLTTTAASTEPNTSAAVPVPQPEEVTTTAPAISAATLSQDAVAPPVSQAAGGVGATAPIGAKPRRRVSRVSGSASGRGINSTRNSNSNSNSNSNNAPGRRKRTTACQP